MIVFMCLFIILNFVFFLPINLSLCVRYKLYILIHSWSYIMYIMIGIFPNNKKNIFLLKPHSTFMTFKAKNTFEPNEFLQVQFFFILLIINGKIVSNIEKEKWHSRKMGAILIKWAKNHVKSLPKLLILLHIYVVPL